jgi:hypothetical protein
MEMKIYEEYKSKVVKGEYQGKSVLEELQKGDYLNGLKESRNYDEAMFLKVAPKVKNDMEVGLINEINRAPSFVRDFIRNAKYGSSVFGVNIDKNIITNVDKRINQLKKILEEDKDKNNVLLNRLSQMKNRVGKKEKSYDKSMEVN